MATAAGLGCSYGHLLMCIKGIRRSQSLMERYRAMDGDQTKADRAANKGKARLVRPSIQQFHSNNAVINKKANMDEITKTTVETPGEKVTTEETYRPGTAARDETTTTHQPAKPALDETTTTHQPAKPALDKKKTTIEKR
jgi:hypothetical protein